MNFPRCATAVVTVLMLALATFAAPADSLLTLMATGDYAAAEAAAREELARLEAATGGDSAEIADVLDVLLEARWRQGKATEPETREIGERSLAMKQRLFGPGSAGVGKTQHHLAIVSIFSGDRETARSLWEQSIENRTAGLGPDHPDVAESLNGLANLLQLQAEFDAARPLYESALRIYSKAYEPNDPRIGRTLNNLGVLLREIGDFAAALPYAEQSLRIKRASFDEGHQEIAVGLQTLGEIYYETGDLDRALENYEQALKISEATLGPEDVEVAAALNNLAHLYHRRGEYAQAIPLFERARAIWEKANGPEHPDVALALNGLASTYESMGELERARELQSRGVSIRDKALGPEHFEVASSLDNLADIEAKLGNDAAAGAAYERSVAIRRGNFGGDHPLVAESLIGLGLTRARTGDDAAALRDARESERIARDHLRLTGRSLAEEHALRYAATRNSGLNLALTLAVDRPGHASTRDVLDMVIRSRAVVLDEIAARNRTVLQNRDPRIAQLAEEFAAARERLANLIVRGPGRFDIETYNGFVAEARDRKELAERELGAASAAFAGEQRRSGASLEDVAANLPDGSALIAYSLYEHLDIASATKDAQGRVERRTAPAVPSYAALVLRADSEQPVAVRLGAAAGIDERIARWKREAARGAQNVRRTPEASEQAYRSVAAELSAAIWQPLAAELGNIERVFIVPDGGVNLVSLAALPADGERYLVESGPTLHYLSAARDLVPGDSSAVGHGMLALGGPDYDATGTGEPSVVVAMADVEPAAGGTRGAACESFQSLKFAALPAAAMESNEVVALWSDARAAGGDRRDRAIQLTGAAAAEAAFKQAAVGRRVLHVATHGFFLGGDCATGGEGSRGITIAEAKEPEAVLTTPVSPLLLSGLALAGANHRDSAAAGEEDGVLTAEEIAGLDLTGVEWAVLSACDTGVGEIQAGEGVFGLRRAIQVAGVKTLIMSLWPVDDEATRRWMIALYRGRLTQRLDTATAVREAALSEVRTRREAKESTHPFYWAAFVAAGDWR